MSRVKGDPRLEGFREPDYAIDVDFAAQIAAVPESGTIKGMFLSELVDEIEQYAPDQRGQIPLAQRWCWCPLFGVARFNMKTHLRPACAWLRCRNRSGGIFSN